MSTKSFSPAIVGIGLCGFLFLAGFPSALGAQPFAVNINFQTNGTPAPANYLADYGDIFGDRGNGFIYGWATAATMRDLTATNVVDFRYGTYAAMQNTTNNFWQMVLTNGLYSVRLVMGSVTRLDGDYRIDVQGAPALAGWPEGTNFWIEATANVAVTNGRLTVSNGDGGYNNRIAFLEIRETDAARLGAPPATNDLPVFTLTNSSGGWHGVESSSNLVNWLPLLTLANAPAQTAGFTDPDAASFDRRFYRARLLLPVAPQIVYSNGFEAAVGSEWSATNLAVTPTGARNFLGRFGNKSVKLNLTNLPPHTALTVAFDFFVLQSWDGNSSVGGPDIFDLSVTGGPALLHATFRNLMSFGPGQTYPGSYPGLVSTNVFTSRMGAVEKSTLGYAEISSSYGDAVYRLGYTFPHTAAAVEFTFTASLNTSGLSDESWGLDNVTVSAQDFR